MSGALVGVVVLVLVLVASANEGGVPGRGRRPIGKGGGGGMGAKAHQEGERGRGRGGGTTPRVSPRARSRPGAECCVCANPPASPRAACPFPPCGPASWPVSAGDASVARREAAAQPFPVMFLRRAVGRTLGRPSQKLDTRPNLGSFHCGPQFGDTHPNEEPGTSRQPTTTQLSHTRRGSSSL